MGIPIQSMFLEQGVRVNILKIDCRLDKGCV